VTPAQIEFVQSSLVKVAPIAEAAADYGHLFKIAPDVKPLFRSDKQEPGRKLMTTLGVVVNNLENTDIIVPAAKALAVKHVGYGVAAAHYAPVGAALVWVLEQGLGGEISRLRRATPGSRPTPSTPA
jgi:hemoglobin-like flavoprotein